MSNDVTVNASQAPQPWLFTRDRSKSHQAEGFAGGFHSPSRRLALHSGVFSLVGTLVGGGTLSVPWAVTRSGLVGGLFLLLLFSVMSAASVQFLLSAARPGVAQNVNAQPRK